MAIPFDHSIQEQTYDTVKHYLNGSHLFQGSLELATHRPEFEVAYGSAKIRIEIRNWDFHPWDPDQELALVNAASCVTQGSVITVELLDYLLQENQRMRFGAFSLDSQHNIWFGHTILGGDHMDLRELESCVLAVAMIADTYDDTLVQRFGGHRAIDLPSETP